MSGHPALEGDQGADAERQVCPDQTPSGRPLGGSIKYHQGPSDLRSFPPDWPVTLRGSIWARLLHSPCKGREISIGRVEATINLGVFELERRQLPIRLASAMTINKAQGLTRRLFVQPALLRALPVRGSQQPVHIPAGAGCRWRRLDQECRL